MRPSGLGFCQWTLLQSTIIHFCSVLSDKLKRYWDWPPQCGSTAHAFYLRSDDCFLFVSEDRSTMDCNCSMRWLLRYLGIEVMSATQETICMHTTLWILIGACKELLISTCGKFYISLWICCMSKLLTKCLNLLNFQNMHDITFWTTQNNSPHHEEQDCILPKCFALLYSHFTGHKNWSYGAQTWSHNSNRHARRARGEGKGSGRGRGKRGRSRGRKRRGVNQKGKIKGPKFFVETSFKK